MDLSLHISVIYREGGGGGGGGVGLVVLRWGKDGTNREGKGSVGYLLYL